MKISLVALTMVLALALQGAPAQAADSHASCVGLGISDHASAGDMPGVIQEVRGFVNSVGVNMGAFISRFAKVHAGTHDPGCEEAAEEIIAELAAG